jgi:hypothetical protein
MQSEASNPTLQKKTTNLKGLISVRASVAPRTRTFATIAFMATSSSGLDASIHIRHPFQDHVAERRNGFVGTRGPGLRIP